MEKTDCKVSNRHKKFDPFWCVLLAKSRYQYNADLLSLPMPTSNSSQKSALHASTCKPLSRGTPVVVTISVTLSKTVCDLWRGRLPHPATQCRTQFLIPVPRRNDPVSC